MSAGGAAAAVRAITSRLTLLALRRARVDLGMLAVVAVVLVLASAAAATAPGVAGAVADAGARETVRRAGSATDVLVDASVGRPAPGVSVITPRAALAIAGRVRAGLPAAIRAVAGVPTAVVVGPLTRVERVNGDVSGPPVSVHVGAVAGAPIRVVAGRLPADGTRDVEVVVGSVTARAASVVVGDRLRYRGSTVLHVVGLVAPAGAPGRRLALDLPGLWRAAPLVTDGSARGTEVSVLATASGALAAAGPDGDDAWTGRVRVPLVPDRFTAPLVPAVADAVQSIGYAPDLPGAGSATLRVASGFRLATASFGEARDAAVARMGLALTGAVAVALAVVALLTGLLVRRRRAAILLERSRGASVAALAVGASAESLALALPAAGLGVALAAIAGRGVGAPDPRAALVVVAVAAIIAPAVTAEAAREVRPAGMRPARSLRRAVAEATVALLATGALLAVRARGLQPSEGAGLDPLLVATPVLVAAAAALAAIRLHPLLVRAAARVAARTRGALALVATAHAERSLTRLPLAVLALAIGVAVAGALLTDAVRAGQEAASWQAIGGDARVSGSLPAGAEAALDDRPGIAAAAVRADDLVGVADGAGTALVTLLAVDRRYPALLAALPAGLAPRDRAALDALQGSGTAGSTLPVLVSGDLRDRLGGGRLRMTLGTRTVALRVLGTLDARPGALGAPPTVTAPLGALAAATGSPARPTDLLVAGPGAERAATALASPAVRVRTRSGWLADQPRLPLVGGTSAVVAASAAAAEAFALIALVAEVLANAPRRRSTAVLLSTVGVRGRVPRLLLLAEVGPVAVGALVAGLAAGGVVAAGLGPVLELGALAGGAVVTPAFTPAVLLVALLGVVPAVLLAVVAESVAARRARPASILRSGAQR